MWLPPVLVLLGFFLLYVWCMPRTFKRAEYCCGSSWCEVMKAWPLIERAVALLPLKEEPSEAFVFLDAALPCPWSDSYWRTVRRKFFWYATGLRPSAATVPQGMRIDYCCPYICGLKCYLRTPTPKDLAPTGCLWDIRILQFSLWHFKIAEGGARKECACYLYSLIFKLLKCLEF